MEAKHQHEFPRYMMMPLDQHYDGGLGATGEAFEQAAQAVTASSDARGASSIHLPINFLYRHAIELYLKSMIVVLHRALELPYGTERPDGPAFVLAKGKWKSLYDEHSLATLWSHVREMLGANGSALKARSKTDWTVPEGLESAIRAIDEADRSSTFFRYPELRTPDADRAKSSWKEEKPECLQDLITAGTKRIKVLAMVDADGTVSQTFRHDDLVLVELSRKLASAAEFLSGAQTALRCDLAGGL